METVKAYKTSDGLLWGDEIAAADHQSLIDSRAELTKLCKDLFFRGMSVDEAINIIMDNRTEIINALTS